MGIPKTPGFGHFHIPSVGSIESDLATEVPAVGMRSTDALSSQSLSLHEQIALTQAVPTQISVPGPVPENQENITEPEPAQPHRADRNVSFRTIVTERTINSEGGLQTNVENRLIVPPTDDFWRQPLTDVIDEFYQPFRQDDFDQE